MSPAEAGRLLRSLAALQQAREDDEFGGKKMNEDKFAFFTEAVFRSPTLQEWLGWNDEERRFTNDAHFKKFLAFITKPAGDKEEGEPAITRAIDARDVLPGLIADPRLMARFERGGIDINQARVEIQNRDAPPQETDLATVVETLERIVDEIDHLPTPRITREGKQAEVIAILNKVHQSATQQITNLSPR